LYFSKLVINSTTKNNFLKKSLSGLNLPTTDSSWQYTKDEEGFGKGFEGHGLKSDIKVLSAMLPREAMMAMTASSLLIYLLLLNSFKAAHTFRNGISKTNEHKPYIT
jgi:hypothetical protein